MDATDFKQNNKLVVLIPAYNEESTIEQVIKEIPKKILGCVVEVIVIDDGSKDQTKAIAESCGVKVITNHENKGVGRSFQIGVENALENNADYLVNIDADGQFQPNEIPLLLEPIINNLSEFTIGDRFTTVDGQIHRPKNMSANKMIGNFIMSKLISSITGQFFNDVSSGFRAYSRRVMMMLNLSGDYTYTQESFIDLLSKGVVAKNIPITVSYFPDRNSRIANNLWKYAWRTIKIILRAFRDYRPLYFFCIMSLPALIISVFSGTFISVHYLRTGSFTPYKIVGFIFIYFSALTIIIWIIGFLADMFTRIRTNQERLLYYQKRQLYDKKQNDKHSV